MSYNPKEIEQKWQKFWEENKTFKTPNPGDTNFDETKEKFYVLDMFPYPSGAGLHVGHPEGMTANDIIARYKTAKRCNVLHPMGWDAFGLPAENYAIKTGTHPKITTKENIDNFRKQIKSLGFSYDWDREVDTTDPKYYKWTQWIFLKLFEAGLAYEQDLPINYCPSCKTGLANEEVLNDFTCERCGDKVVKKKLRQWVLAITKYADRLLTDVDKLDWPESIKEMQRNWIGKSEGAEFEMKKSDDNTKTISVYTTRIDTVFGMTYAVLAPDHESVQDFITEEQKEICENYIDEASKKSDQDRTADNKEKTGVFTGSYVINPFNDEKVPLWIGDYVLGNYGTGAVMAVPAHDERDFEFAKKYNLEIKQSISQQIGKFNSKHKQRDSAVGIIENSEGKILLEYSHTAKVYKLPGGGIDEGEAELEAVSREIIEETGYTDFTINEKMGAIHTTYFSPRRDTNFNSFRNIYSIKLNSNKKIDQNLDEGEVIDHEWTSKEEVLEKMYSQKTGIDFGEYIYINEYLNGKTAFTQYGILTNSGDFSGLTSKEAQEQLTQFAEKNNFGTKKVNYKLRDWLFSRQRYWGEPIPLIHVENEAIDNLPRVTSLDETMEENTAYVLKTEATENSDSRTLCSKGKEKSLVINGKIISNIYSGITGYMICDYTLPLELPETDNFEPAGDGNSPLSLIEDFVNIKLADNLSGKRETNTMPQWGGSCWYYLRYMDPNNSENLVDKEIQNYWDGVDSYVGGAEHAVLHLLYARFWHKFLFDIGVVKTDEPFHKLRNQGLIQAYSYQNPQGKLIANDLVEEKEDKFFDIETGEELTKVVAKMSKSLKNVVNPDDIIEEYGSDSLRLYEMYMADFKDAAPWNTNGITGVRRFLEKSERLFTVDAKISTEEDLSTMKLVHKTIKKVEEDINNYKFNTAIAALIILVNNGLPTDIELQREWRYIFVRLLHPFAPHLAEELHERMHKEKVESIFTVPWPKFDESMVVDNEVVIGVQVMGKVRGEVKISKTEDKEKALEKAKSEENIAKFLEGKTIVKEIYVPGKIINFVVR